MLPAQNIYHQKAKTKTKNHCSRIVYILTEDPIQRNTLLDLIQHTIFLCVLTAVRHNFFDARKVGLKIYYFYYSPFKV